MRDRQCRLIIAYARPKSRGVAPAPACCVSFFSKLQTKNTRDTQTYLTRLSSSQRSQGTASSSPSFRITAAAAVAYGKERRCTRATVECASPKKGAKQNKTVRKKASAFVTNTHAPQSLPREKERMCIWGQLQQRSWEKDEKMATGASVVEGVRWI